jgi:hypothetical protein
MGLESSNHSSGRYPGAVSAFCERSLRQNRRLVPGPVCCRVAEPTNASVASSKGIRRHATPDKDLCPFHNDGFRTKLSSSPPCSSKAHRAYLGRDDTTSSGASPGGRLDADEEDLFSTDHAPPRVSRKYNVRTKPIADDDAKTHGLAARASGYNVICWRESRRYMEGGQDADTHPEACHEQEAVGGSLLHARLDDMSAEKSSSPWHLQA